MANAERLRQVVASLRSHPEQFDMNTFVSLASTTAAENFDPWCGTMRCVAGEALLCAGGTFRARPGFRGDWLVEGFTADGTEVEEFDEYAAGWLELTHSEQQLLFYFYSASLDVIERAVELIIAADYEVLHDLRWPLGLYPSFSSDNEYARSRWLAEARQERRDMDLAE